LVLVGKKFGRREIVADSEQGGRALAYSATRCPEAKKVGLYMQFQVQSSPLSRQESEDGSRTSILSSLRRRGRASFLLGSVIALAAFAVPAGTWAQAG
jgi:hypothetical protein